jgi:hypothetical protein
MPEGDDYIKNNDVVDQGSAVEPGYHAHHEKDRPPVATERNLIGKFFHSWDSEGVLGWQGQILRKQPPNCYLVQLCSWVDGNPTDQVIVTEEKVESFTFYDSDYEMRRAGDAYLRRVAREGQR